jgi:hypothetical protein
MPFFLSDEKPLAPVTWGSSHAGSKVGDVQKMDSRAESEESGRRRMRRPPCRQHQRAARRADDAVVITLAEANAAEELAPAGKLVVPDQTL